MKMRSRACLFLTLCLLLVAGAQTASAEPLRPGAAPEPQVVISDSWDFGLASDSAPVQAQNLEPLLPGMAHEPLWQEHNFDHVTADAADHDWYRFQVTQAQLDSWATWLFEAHSETSAVDPVLEIYGPDDTSPTFNFGDPRSLMMGGPDSYSKKGADNFFWPNRSAKVSFTPRGLLGCTPGWYYIRVRPTTGGGSYQGTAGEYVFTAKRGGFERLGGADRFETAARISQERFDTRPMTPKPGALVVNGWNYPDALAGASLAGYLGGPILLANQTSVPIPTDDELSRLMPNEAYALGGDSNISPSTRLALGNIIWPAQVADLHGSGRVQTAREVAEEIVAQGGTLSSLAFVVNGWAWPDALAATPLAARGSPYVPILLTHKDYCDVETLAAIQTLGITDVVIIGSENVVSQTAYWQIVDALEMQQDHVLRLGGADRYETAMKVALWSTDHFGPGVRGDNKIGTTGASAKIDDLNDYYIGVATGENFPDALGAGVFCGKLGMPLLLTPKASLSKRIFDPTGQTTDYVHSMGNTVWTGFVFGSENAVSYNAMYALDRYVSGQDYTP